jgi:hypothetical protein
VVVEGRGVSPDVDVPLSSDELRHGNDNPLNAALDAVHSVHGPAPLSGGLLQRTHLSITGRAFREVVVPGIEDRAISPSELDQ